MKIILLFFLMSSLFVSYGQNKKNRIHYDKLNFNITDSCYYYSMRNTNLKFSGLAIHKKGKVRTEFNFKNGKLNGENVVYSGNQKIFACNFIDGLMHGKNMAWCIDGHLTHQTVYDHGNQINEGFWWYCDGKVKTHQIFENGKKVSQKTYYPNGLLKSEEINNAYLNTYIFYYESGKIKSKILTSWDNNQTQCWDENGNEIQCSD